MSFRTVLLMTLIVGFACMTAAAVHLERGRTAARATIADLRESLRTDVEAARADAVRATARVRELEAALAAEQRARGTAEETAARLTTLLDGQRQVVTRLEQAAQEAEQRHGAAMEETRQVHARELAEAAAVAARSAAVGAPVATAPAAATIATPPVSGKPSSAKSGASAGPGPVVAAPPTPQPATPRTVAPTTATVTKARQVPRRQPTAPAVPATGPGSSSAPADVRSAPALLPWQAQPSAAGSPPAAVAPVPPARLTPPRGVDGEPTAPFGG
jgi:hypothetical protein